MKKLFSYIVQLFTGGTRHKVTYQASVKNADPKDPYSTEIYDSEIMFARNKEHAKAKLQDQFGKSTVITILRFEKEGSTGTLSTKYP